MPFPYDAELLAATRSPVTTVADVLRVMDTIEATCSDADGLKWFNWLYRRVTQDVAARIAAGDFADGPWLALLDIEFAKMYFAAIAAGLGGGRCPGSWRVLLACRDNAEIARLQFALAGVNAHINHDLPQALVTTAALRQSPPQHVTPHYVDYTSLNSTFDNLIDVAKVQLRVRLLGTPLPLVSHLEDTIAAWNVHAAREKAWINAEVLWALRPLGQLAPGFIDTLDGLTTVAGKALLVPVR